MSRIARTASSPDRVAPNPITLKRKASEDDNPIPTKVPALAGRVLKPSLVSNTHFSIRASAGLGSRPLYPLTRPQPALASTITQRSKRSVSAPPTKLGSGINSLSNLTLLKSEALGTVVDEEENDYLPVEAVRAADIAKVSADMELERGKAQELQAFRHELSKQLADTKSQEIEQRRHRIVLEELDELKEKHTKSVMELELDKTKLQREVRDLQEEIRSSKLELEREREVSSVLKNTIAQRTTTQMILEAQVSALQATNSALNASLAVANSLTGNVHIELERATSRVAELEQELREAETTRRRLHNMVQELKGNIRVFCRVRPPLSSDKPLNPDDASSLLASVQFPDKRDHNEIVLSANSESATGTERKEIWKFKFDRVFEPDSTQESIFQEISELTQSCIDGYNVCIFAYGQTGSGKSFTMEGGSTPETAGVIPRAVELVFDATQRLSSKGWVYKMEGQFLEIYNETINDLLGNSELDKKKHEIRHDKGTTKVTDIVVVPLETPSQVRSLLLRAQSRRTVASTLMNERSSRSHSVFTLRISGNNPLTKESCEGSLNLVDLAGSERLNSSGAGNDKGRLKETQNINRSLSALGDVIAALGNAQPGHNDKHIPYRNSKLTYLLQNSLSGNSKTLMFLNLSPLAAHLSESLCSLRFATKVNSTTIGVAKKQLKTSP